MLLEAVFAGRAPEPFRIGVWAIAGVLVTTAVASPIWLVLRSARRLLRAGYRHDDLVRALEVEVDRRREEQEFAGGGRGPTAWQRLMRGKMYAALGLAALAGAAAFFVPYPGTLVAFGLFGLSCATALATGFAALAASRGRLEDAEQRRLRFWRGPLGRWLFRLAGIRLRGAAPAAAAHRPTEVALGIAALELFDRLPAGARRQLGDVPSVVRGLESRIRVLRGDGEGEGARLTEALAALEAIRLDLLRLHGGVGTLDGLTADLGAARDIGAEIDALLEGRRAAEQALHSPHA
jgi:serine/threonine-protein kinase